MKTLKELEKYLKHWKIFLVSIVFCLTVAILYVRYTPSKYRISSTLLIQDDAKGEGMLKGTAFSDLQMFKTTKTVDNEMEVLRSRDLIYKVLKELSLETSYSKNNWLTRAELYGETLPVRVIVYRLTNNAYIKKYTLQILDENIFVIKEGDKGRVYHFNQVIQNPDYTIRVIKGPAFAKNYKPISIKFKNLVQMAEAFSLARLTVVPIIKDANTIIISMIDEVPQRGIDILSKLIETYNYENVMNKNTIARNTISFIDNRLKYLTRDLSAVEQDVENYKQQNQVTDIMSNAQMNLDNSQIYNQQLAGSEMQLSIITSLETYLRQPGRNSGLVPSTLGLKDATLEALTERYNSLQLEKQRLLSTNNADNPLVVNINEQLGSIRLSLQENLKNIKNRLVIERNNSRSKYAQSESRIRDVPSIERGLLERNREQDVKISLYHYLLQKREETALSLTATIPTSQVIDKPAYNTVPEQPKGDLIYLCSFLLGVILPAGIIYCRDKFNTKVQDASEVEFITGAKVLGELSNKGKLGSVVVQKGSRTTISELFRYIRSNLNYINSREQNQVLLITSSIKGEGKTFFSVNLGLTLSLTDKKVVLLEFDLRKPDLLQSIKVKSELGITDFLNFEDVTLDNIISPSELSPNLSVIGCGTFPDNPAELLMSDRIGVLFEELREKFDYIIVDTSPVGQVADAFSLAKYTDSSIYLVRYNYTNKFQLRILQDIYENEKLKNPMVVFNDAKEDNSDAYAYGRYAYN
ncbi:polysaccharide biosynthesis tyrosine autokinase [Pedobacter sp. P351]|uniref:GumC family protein n=1 Tax=Pedobacter superstes TaxID=3133441 RepID=UPI0030A622F9